MRPDLPPPLDTLPSNVSDFPTASSPPVVRRRRGAGIARLLLAVVVVGGLLAVVQTVVGFDQLTRWVVTTASNLRASGGGVPESRNWAGYDASGGTFTQVSATWNVPSFAPNSPAGADAIWVGIGGLHGTDLIQAGTQETVTGHGTTSYAAWVETLPQASRPVPLPISAGDSVSVSLAEQADGSWLIAFVNNTSGKSYQVTLTYASSHSSAEWVVEAPSARRGRILPLDGFGSVTFTQAATVRDGQSLTIAQASGHPITMIGQRGKALAKPSGLADDGAGFNVLQSLV